MSYAFSLSFVSCNESEAYRLMHHFAKEMGKAENVRKMLEDETYYIPTIKYRLYDHDRVDLGRLLDEYWLMSLLTVRFVYWPQYELLALVGPAWPHLKEYFPKSVYFQDSCDQDYEFSEWKDICPFFDHIMEEAGALSDEEIIKETELELDDERFAEAKDYYVRTAVYKRIFKELALNDWLYGKENGAFERYSICAIETIEQRIDLSQRVLQPLVRSRSIGYYDTCHAQFPVVRGNHLDTYSIQYQYRNRHTYERNEPPTEEEFIKKVTNICDNFAASDRGKLLMEKYEFSAADVLAQMENIELAKYGLMREKSADVIDIRAIKVEKKE